VSDILFSPPGDQVTRKAEQDGLKTMVITQENLEEFIGKPQFTQDKYSISLSLFSLSLSLSL
jgi:hypothetical protein